MSVKVFDCARRLKLQIMSCECEGEREKKNWLSLHAAARELVGDHNGLGGALRQRQLHLRGGK